MLSHFIHHISDFMSYLGWLECWCEWTSVPVDQLCFLRHVAPSTTSSLLHTHRHFEPRSLHLLAFLIDFGRQCLTSLRPIPSSLTTCQDLTPVASLHSSPPALTVHHSFLTICTSILVIGTDLPAAFLCQHGSTTASRIGVPENLLQCLRSV
jgi:hypothetical protein